MGAGRCADSSTLRVYERERAEQAVSFDSASTTEASSMSPGLAYSLAFPQFRDLHASCLFG